MTKEIKIKICGTAGSGKSVIAWIIRRAISFYGIHGVSIDDELPQEDAFMEKIIAENKDDFDVEIETVQIKFPVLGH